MPKRAQLIVVLFSWFLATGAQWDLVQAFGWGKMFITDAETMSFGAAAKRTFDGEMCSICRAVNQAKRQENKSLPPEVKKGERLLFVIQPAGQFFVSVPESASWRPADFDVSGMLRASPPTPPPRV
ncbi:MAG TPA: hypothetical protein VHE61_14100 [Opitutaceae bacterium]|nr:hypothetical protein [Opitutaceae bacterium]